MKKIFFLPLMGLLFFACTSTPKETGFSIQATVTNLPAGEVYLMKLVDGKRQIIDTAQVDSTGAFLFKGQVETPELVYIQLADTLPWLSVFVENKEIKLTAALENLQDAVISGSATQDEFKTYRDSLKTLFGAREKDFRDRYMAARAAKNEAEMNKIGAAWDSLDSETALFKENYIKSKPASFITPAIIWSELSYSKEAAELESLVTALDSAVQKSVYVKLLNERIAVLKKTAIGQPAIDFTLNAPDGSPVTLSAHFGKYLLVDFWASWCGPCRMENPAVVAAWKTYNKKGFDVFGVSLDRDSASWVEAIAKDKLTWTHVSDLKYWESAPAALYGVRSIPSNVLLDPKGIIIAKNLRGEELKTKLAELLK